MPELDIKGFIETSFLDWDGKIVATIYLPNCNFDCPFCHNSSLVKIPQAYETISIEKIEKYLIEHKDFIDGICITGGEPTIHKDKGLYGFVAKIKGHGFKVKFDTNGTSPDAIKYLLENKLIDFIAMDIKGPLNEKYDELSGVKVNLKNIKESIKLIMRSDIPYEFRTTVVPNMLEAADVAAIAKDIKGAKKYVLQQFISKNCSKEELKSFVPYTKEALQAMMKSASSYVDNICIRGA